MADPENEKKGDQEDKFLWVKYLETRPVEVDSTGCRNVAAFIEKAKDKLSPKLDSYSLGDLSLHHNDEELEGDWGAKELLKRKLNRTLTYKTPLVIKYSGPIQNNDQQLNPQTPIAGVPRQASESSLSIHLTTVEDSKLKPRKRQRTEAITLTSELQALANAQLLGQCIVSPDNASFPLTKVKLNKLFVRKSYEDIFDLLLEEVKTTSSFGISGTPGIGKSLFFVYILYRFLNDSESKILSFKPNRILYHTGSSYYCFDLLEKVVTRLSQFDAAVLLDQLDAFYIMDGTQVDRIKSSCVTLFISSPRSDDYKQYIKQKQATEWFFPIWTLDELNGCRDSCYSGLPKTFLENRIRKFGGIARLIFSDWVNNIDENGIPKKLAMDLEAALNDEVNVKIVINPPQLLKVFSTSYSLVHIIVDEEYQYEALDAASDYIAHELCVRHYEKMIKSLQTLLGRSPSVISRHLFEIYGNRVFSKGGKTLKCRNLQNGNTFDLQLDEFELPTTAFGRNSIPLVLPTSYYETSDDETFPAIDALSPQGMYQFSVASEHPIGGVSVLEKICQLFRDQNKALKLYFVVPAHLFLAFKKQTFNSDKGNKSVNEIQNLEQYVLELPVGL